MRIFRLALWVLALTPVVGSAKTQVIFNQEGTQATVVLMGVPGDLDPAHFYSALNVPAEDIQGKWSKKLSLPAADGSKGLDVVCVFSKAIKNNGTCTLIFRHAPDILLVDKGRARARLFLTGAAAEQFAAFFVVPSDINSIYRSGDGRLQVSAVKEQGSVNFFVIDWYGRGIY